MKNLRYLLLLCFTLVTGICSAQLRSHVDERHELSGIVWRLAGAEEYVNNRVIEAYATDIETYFGTFKNHPLLAYIRHLRKDPYYVAFNGISEAANLIEIVKGRIRLRPEVNLSEFVKGDPRWTEKTVRQYVVLLDDFYRKSRFTSFFAAHRTMYDQATKKMDAQLEKVRCDWFESFFGKPFGKPEICVCLSYGHHNYAVPASFWQLLLGQEGYGITIGCCHSDDAGMPVFPDSSIKVIVHEFSHNFSAPILDSAYDQFRVSAESIYPHVKDALARVAYVNPKSIIIEGLNELFVNMYYNEAAKQNAYYNIGCNQNNGFVWMSRAVRFMDNFYADRKTYPSIEAFLPELVGFMDGIAANMETVMREFAQQRPYIVNIFPAAKVDVDPAIREIRIQFSRPMATGLTGFAQLIREGVTSLKSTQQRWTDEWTYVIEIDGTLEPNTVYGTRLMGFCFQSAETGHTPEKDVELIFKTAQQ